MLFNSIDFAFFIIIVFLGHWFVFRRLRLQNLFLLAASYFFYAFWDWRFLFLLLFSTALDYYTGNRIYNSQGTNKRNWLIISVTANLGFLFFFKYYNFFTASFTEAFTFFGYKISRGTLNIILPVGISFYTFHGLSYVIDIYKDRIKPVQRFSDYALFVSYFPLLVAGPIERATHLLPQLLRKRQFNYPLATDGLRQFLWGLFKKAVIADNCAFYADQVFNDPGSYNGSTLLLGSVLFAFQIYADFSGYTDMASGISKLFGIRLLRNFNYPYFAVDIADFWRRWHISLSSWFRDYVYIPLGGSKGTIIKQLRNVFIIFLLSGFWHGANTTFILWGFIHACLFIPLLLLKRNRRSAGYAPALKNFPSMLFTFILVTFGWIFFRATSISDAIIVIRGILSPSLLSYPAFLPKKLLLLIAILLITDWLGRQHEHPLKGILQKMPVYIRYALYYLLVVLIFIFMGNEAQFIYFQF